MILMLLFVCCLKSPEGRTTFIPPYGTSTNLRVTSRTKTREVIKMLMTKFQVCLLKYQNFSYMSCLVICLLVGEMNWNFPLPELGTQKGTDCMGYLSNQGTVISLGLIHLVSQVKWFFNVIIQRNPMQWMSLYIFYLKKTYSERDMRNIYDL